MKKVFHPDYERHKETLSAMIANFSTMGEIFVKGKRNSIRVAALANKTINIKSFRVPNPVNAVVYRYFRKSKARRSFEFANYLLQNGIGTPQPVAYFENYNLFGLSNSYYVSEHLESDLLFRDLPGNPDYPDRENIIRQFARFTFELHQKGIEFKDHSPGNTLIKNLGNGCYSFFLVDLNRMVFHKSMPLELRMKNMSRLTSKVELLKILANEYAKASGEDPTQVFYLLSTATARFHKGFYRKKRIKNKLLFRRK